MRGHINYTQRLGIHFLFSLGLAINDNELQQAGSNGSRSTFDLQPNARTPACMCLFVCDGHWRFGLTLSFLSQPTPWRLARKPVGGLLVGACPCMHACPKPDSVHGWHTYKQKEKRMRKALGSLIQTLSVGPTYCTTRQHVRARASEPRTTSQQACGQRVMSASALFERHPATRQVKPHPAAAPIAHRASTATVPFKGTEPRGGGGQCRNQPPPPTRSPAGHATLPRHPTATAAAATRATPQCLSFSPPACLLARSSNNISGGTLEPPQPQRPQVRCMCLPNSACDASPPARS